MKAFSALLAICAGNSPAHGEFPTQRPVTRSFDVFFDLRGWVNNGEAGDLRRHRAHYDVTVMGAYRGVSLCKIVYTNSICGTKCHTWSIYKISQTTGYPIAGLLAYLRLLQKSKIRVRGFF